MKYIERSWEGYRKLLPADAPEAQVRETRQAFYAGATAIFTGMMFIEGDMKRMMEIQHEIDAFGQELKQAKKLATDSQRVT